MFVSLLLKMKRHTPFVPPPQFQKGKILVDHNIYFLFACNAWKIITLQSRTQKCFGFSKPSRINQKKTKPRFYYITGILVNCVYKDPQKYHNAGLLFCVYLLPNCYNFIFSLKYNWTPVIRNVMFLLTGVGSWTGTCSKYWN